MAACLPLSVLSACSTSPATVQQTERPRVLFISPHGEPFRAEKSGPSALEKWFAQADTSQDSRISNTEFAADADRYLHRLDTNQDGAIVSAEVTTLLSAHAPEVIRAYAPLEDLLGRREALTREDLVLSGALSNRESKGLLARPHGSQAFGLLNEIEPTMSADVNFDRHVTSAEFTAAAAVRFGKLDVNNDGFFELKEAPSPAWLYREQERKP